jgi:hypothetical protein
MRLNGERAFGTAAAIALARERRTQGLKSMMVRTALLLCRTALLLFFLCAPCLAENGPPRCITSFDARTVSAMNNLQAEMTTCWVYYNFRKRCTPPGQYSGEIEKSTNFAIAHLQNFMFKIGTGICMTNDAMLARMELFSIEQRKVVADSCVNFDSLVRRHADRCKKVVENGDAILAEYMKK